MDKLPGELAGLIALIAGGAFVLAIFVALPVLALLALWKYVRRPQFPIYYGPPNEPEEEEETEDIRDDKP